MDEISIGKPALREIKNGECAYVPTGGMIPDGADAMVMVEYTELFDKRDAALSLIHIYYAALLNAGTGTEYTADSLLEVGERIYNLERLFNKAAGMRPEDCLLYTSRCV